MPACDDVRRLLFEEDARSLSAEARASLQAHLSACGACRAEGAALDRLWAALGEASDREASPGFAARVREAVRRFGTARTSVRGGVLLKFWFPAAAAAALLAVLVGRSTAPPMSPSADTAVASASALSSQDEEIVANLDLLENLEVAEKLDVIEVRGRLSDVEGLLDSQEGVR